MTGTCSTCEGCGQVADTDDQEPWTAWSSLPPGSDVMVRAGLVSPIPCPDCTPTHHGAALADITTTAQDRAIDAARDLARSLATLMDRWAEASQEVRDRDLWAPAGRALSRLEVALEDLDEADR